MKKNHLFIGLFMVCFLIPSFPREGRIEKKYPIPNLGLLILHLPHDWKDEITKKKGEIFPRIEIHPLPAGSGKISIKVVWKIPGLVHFDSDAKLHNFILEKGQEKLKRARENQLKLIDFGGPSQKGFYYSLRDRDPAAGEYEFLTEGAVRVDKLVLLFSLVAHEREGRVFKEFRQILVEARFRSL